MAPGLVLLPRRGHDLFVHLGVGFMFGGYLMVPLSYVSGAPLGDSETTFAGTSFAALGLLPGRYVWSWGDGVTADTLTVQVGAPPPPAVEGRPMTRKRRMIRRWASAPVPRAELTTT